MGNSSKFVRASELEATPDILKRVFDPQSAAPRDKYAHLRNTQSERNAYIEREERAAGREADRVSDVERYYASTKPSMYEDPRSVVWDEEDRTRKNMRYNEASSQAINRVGYGMDDESIRPDTRYSSYTPNDNRDYLHSYSAAGGGLGHLFEDDITNAIKFELESDNEKRQDIFERRDSSKNKQEARQAWEARKRKRFTSDVRPHRLSDSRATQIVKIAQEYDAEDTDWMFYKDEILAAQESQRMAGRVRAKNERLALKRNHITDEDWDYNKRQDWQRTALNRLAGIDNSDVNAMQSDIFQQEILRQLQGR